MVAGALAHVADWGIPVQIGTVEGFDRHFAHILRTLGFIAAAVIVVRMLLSPAAGPPVEFWLRASEVLVALAVGVLATPHRPRAALNLLALTLLLTVAAVNAARLALRSTTPWETAAILIGVLLSAVFLLSWSWRWQLLLAVFTVGPTMAALVWPGDVGLREAWSLFVTVVGVGAGSVVGVYVVQRFREGVTASEARYRALFAGARDAILILEPGGVVSECNPAFATLVGEPMDGLVGRAGKDFLSPLQPDGRPGPEWFDRYLRSALAGDHETVSGYVQRADGSEVEVEMTSARLQTPQGLVIQVVLRDLTEHRTLERRQQRERRVAALARLAGGISHQFNNLLAGVLTDATALRADVQREDHAEALDEMAEAARRGRALARELMRFAQYETVVLRRVAPGAVIERVVTLAKGTAVAGVNLVADASPGLPDVAADVDELVHACLQLVVNAQDAMPDGGTITLSALPVAVNDQDPGWPGAAVGDYVSLTVRDTGRGMDAATRDRAFEPFAAGASDEVAGVGLPAVYGIVRAHHGTVRIDSAPGHGTAVHLLIPVWKEEPVPALRRPAPPSAAPRATVLVVDDEAMVRHAVSRALARFGYRVLAAEDAAAAVTQFTSAAPPVDLVVLDIVFPGGARTVFRNIREQTRDVPILLSSGYASHGDDTIQALLAAGACGFLRKPYEVEELRRAVAHALGEADD